MNFFKKRGLFLLLIIVFITSCTSQEQCMIEKKDYSCIGFNINDVVHEDENITISDIEYMSEGLKIKGLLADPKEAGKFPLIMFNHGGKQGIEELNWIETLADNGYIVLASQYRGEGGSEGDIEVALGETTDVMNLLECGKSFDKVNKDKIGVIGFSHGGAITVQAMGLTDDFKAGVEFWGATDIKKRFENIRGKDDPIIPWVEIVGKPDGEEKLTEELLKRSAVYCVDRINAPLLIFHGKLDKVMPYEYALDLADALRGAKKKYEFVSYDYIGHDFEREDGTKDTEIEAETMKITLDWFDKYLK